MHCSDDDLILDYYGEPGAQLDVAGHLATCSSCRARRDELTETLQLVSAAGAIDVDEAYGTQLWRRLAPRLPAPNLRPVVSWFSWNPVWLSAAAAALLVLGFVGGRFWPERDAPVLSQRGPAGETAFETRHRVLLLSVVDHLERSDRVLTDILNTADGGDITVAQQWADDLVAASRLYRQDAIESNEPAIAGVLDELERALLEIVHSPSMVSAAELEQIHRRVDAAVLVFKVRVLGDELRQRPLAAPDRTHSTI